MKTIADPPKRDRWARLRFSIIGPLLAAPPEPGQLNSAFAALGGQDLAPPRHGPGRALRRLDPGALVLHGAACGGPGGRAQGPPARQRGLLPQPERSGRRHAERAVPRASGLDGSTAPGQSARGVQGERLAAWLRTPRCGAICGPRACIARPAPSEPPRAPSRRAIGWSNWRCAASRSSTSQRCGTWTSTTARARCSPAPAPGSSRCCWASSTTARAWCATCSGTWTRARRAWCTGCRRRS